MKPHIVPFNSRSWHGCAGSFLLVSLLFSCGLIPGQAASTTAELKNLSVNGGVEDGKARLVIEALLNRLPGDQDKLISDVAAVNPNTVVVLNTTLPVAMPWLDKVKGVLEMWYPGDEGGPATANVLLGKADPAGRLPITWPVKLSDMVAQDSVNHPERTNQGVEVHALASVHRDRV